MQHATAPCRAATTLHTLIYLLAHPLTQTHTHMHTPLQVQLQMLLYKQQPLAGAAAADDLRWACLA